MTLKGKAMRWRGRVPSVMATVEFCGDVIAVSTERQLDQGMAGCARPMRLEGAEALELYLVEMERNLAELAAQIATLHHALAERRRLLSRIAASCGEEDAAACPMH